MGFSQNKGYPFGGPHNKDYSMLGSILGSHYFGKLPYSRFYLSMLVDYVGCRRRFTASTMVTMAQCHSRHGRRPIF